MPLIANVSAAKETDPARIRELLVQQVTATVRWRECVQAMVALGVDSFVELGSGKVLSGLIRRIAPDAADGFGRHAGGGGGGAEGAVTMFQLDGKPALVTGASGGIGAAIARALHARGAVVVLSGTRRDALDSLAAELGERAFVCPADLRDDAAAEALMEAAEQAAGPSGLLVNNAGMTRDMLALRMNDADWQTVLDVDLRHRSAWRAPRCGACCAGGPGGSSTSARSSARPAMPARPIMPPPRPDSWA